MNGATVIRYARDADMADEKDDGYPGGDEGHEPGGKGDPTETVPGAHDEPDGDEDDHRHGEPGHGDEPPDGVEPEFHAKVMRCMRQGFHDVYKEHTERNAAGGRADTSPGATPSEVARMARKPEETRRLTRLEDENEQYKKRLEDLERNNRYMKRRAELTALRDEHGVEVEVEEELKPLAEGGGGLGDMPEDHYRAVYGKIARNYRRDPTKGPDIPVAPDDPKMKPKPSETVPTDEAELEEQLNYIRDESLKTGKAVSPKDALAAVRQRKKR